jgi:hypothetical protein
MLATRRVGPIVLVALAMALGEPAPAAALPRCSHWATRIASLQGIPTANPGRIFRLQKRYADHCVHLNEIQVLGSHNSYHLLPRPALLSALLALDPQFEGFVYEHLPLDQQFETQGIRQIELDVFYDPLGGHYGTRVVLPLLGDDPVAPPIMFEPGLKVFHVQEVDFESTCLTLIDCLKTIRTWSAANRRHLPLVVLIEAKDDVIIDPLNLGFVVPLPFDAAAFDALDEEIRSVFPPKRMITPDDVRGSHATLEEAVLTDGWPTLKDSRGKVLFLLDNEGKQDVYTAGHPNLEGRVLFTNANPGDPDAAFIKRNDPIADGVTEIPSLVQAGYLVRTRADADTVQARTGDTTQREAALSSGAHYVSTDYPVPNPDFGTGYYVEIPGGEIARCNPFNAPPACNDAALEIPH